MQTSVAAEIAARLELFQDAFAFCRQGGFSFARFLALVPDRLRLALGDEGHRVRVPVTVAEDFAARIAEHLPMARDGRPVHAVGAMDELRRAVRLAQLDPSLSPVPLLAWSRQRADGLLGLLSAVYRQGFGEVGRGEGGTETAYLLHLVLTETIRREVVRFGADRFEAQVLLPTMVDAAVEGALAQDRDLSLSPRLAYQLAATRSPLSFGADADRLAARPVNAYRTIPRALQLARRIVQPPLELIPLDRVARTMAERLVVEPALATALLKDLLLDRIRDAALLAVMQTYEPGRPAVADLLAAVVDSPTTLVQSVFNHPRRRRLLEQLHGVEGPKALGALVELLRGAPDVEQGDAAPLGVHGNVQERALLASRGAICLVLEAYAEDLKRDVHGIVQWLEPDDAVVAYREGRCYRLSADDRPLYRLPPRFEEAFLFVDASELVRYAAQQRPAALGDLVSRWLMRPLLARYEAFRSADALRMVYVAPDQACFAGDIGTVVEFVEAAREVVWGLRAELERPVADVLGGTPNAIEEADEELRRIEERMAAVDGAIRRTPADDESMRLLQDSRLVLARRHTALSEARRRLAGLSGEGEVEVGFFVAFGPAAVAIPLGADVAPAQVWFSQSIMEARRGCARVPWVRDERRSRLALRRQARGDADARLPFGMSLRTRDERTALYNAGCGLSGRAFRAFLKARSAVFSYLELEIELRELPEHARRQFVFDRDPERFVLCVGRVNRELVMTFRAVGQHGEATLWELVSPAEPFIEVLLAFAGRGTEVSA